jgi:hypothetical protein
MKSILSSIFILLLVINLSAKKKGAAEDVSGNIGYLQFVIDLGNKKNATFADAVKFFVIVMGKDTKNFEQDYRILLTEKIVPSEKHNPFMKINRGLLALMTAKYLKLNDSLLYLIIGGERYAYVACIADKIMEPDGSEWDKISGEDLIEIMTMISKRNGGER